ncbi:tRNA (N(6)-L-threonylcarbamoyladenosine(37)-C(2))-methylthiotransferase MtaB [Oscillospiraceae bacterium OttesenSCG-928-F05]|nr:tRNA (N(6)-L-threonylcarbamoyladenosine(37)-C(2))-methylthiotransferase MtaB [Oscillospiraceae bacterium OttesenSCG-928-F05]
MRVAFFTLGCKVNQMETAAVRRLLAESGHIPVEEGGEADACVINTCAVTAESARKSRTLVRRLRKERPEALICLCGCYPQSDGEGAEALGADYIGGAGERRALVEFLNSADHEKHILLPPPEERTVFERLPVGSVAGRTRAFLKIEDGCHNFCTYCIIPRLRGPVRSESIAALRGQAAELAAKGYREIVLVGIEISSFGKDTGESLAALIEAVAEVAPGVRLRLGSLEPRTVDRAFCERIAGLRELCPHFHLSLQSGSGEILRRMGRRYTPERYLESAALLRAYFENPAITTDIICGFPGETETHFRETEAFMAEVGFADVHIFPYSKREGTPAALLPDQLTRAEKAARAARLAEVKTALRQAYFAGQTGRVLSVLFESEREEGGALFSEGHSENYMPVRVPGGELGGRIFPVRITGAEPAFLMGERAE